MGASYWTGTWICQPPEDCEVVASDPRITGVWRQLDNRAWYSDRVDGGDIEVLSATVRIENADGAWAGTISGAYGVDKGAHEWNVLKGEGTYEGLTAMFLWNGKDSSMEGVIIPADPPAIPEPVAPFAEVTEPSPSGA
jgi:hypothetical protein